MRFTYAKRLYFLCLLISGVFLLPQMRFPYPNFIDVVETLFIGTAVFQNTLGEFSNQMRFWPALKFERSILNAVFAGHPQLYFFYFSVLLATTVYMMFRIVHGKNRNLITTVFIFILLYISPVTVDTYWRLGAAETLFTLFLVSSIYTLTTKRYGWTIVFLAGLMATKESAIFYIPIYLGIFLLQKRYVATLILGILYGGFLVKMYELIVYAVTHQHYTSMLTTTAQGIGEMALHIIQFYPFYITIVWITLILFLYRRLWGQGKIQSKAWDMGYVFLALCLAGIVTLVSFQNTYQAYYAFPFVVTAIVWMMYELAYTEKKIVYGIMVLSMGFFFLFRIPEQALWKMEYWQNDYAGDNALIDVMLKNRSVRYQFIQEYRPEYTMGLTYMLGTRENATHVGTIFLAAKEKGYANANLLCSSTLFQRRYCKWGVVYNE